MKHTKQLTVGSALMRTLLMLLTFTINVVAQTGPSQFDTNPPEVWVCPSGNCGHGSLGYNSIQVAVDAVSAGGTVHVAAGTYTENIFVDKPVNLIGEGNTATTINGNDAGNCITLVAPNANRDTIKGFSITNGNNGIWGETDSTLIADCIIYSNLATGAQNGNGIMLEGDNDCSTIIRNVVHGNDHYGIFVGSFDNNKISSGNRILNNSVYNNGVNSRNLTDRAQYGIILATADENLIQGNTIYDHNTWQPSGEAGGTGIYVARSARNTITGNTIRDNVINIEVSTAAGARYGGGTLIQGNTLLNPTLWSVMVINDAATTKMNFNVLSSTPANQRYVRNLQPIDTLDARYNWFDGQSSPNPGGFQGLVDYSNSYATGATVSVFPTTYYLSLNSSVGVAVMALVPAGAYVKGVDLSLNWSNDVGIPDVGGPLEGSFFSSGGESFFAYEGLPGSSAHVSQALLGATGVGNPTIPYVGSLFTMQFKGVSAGTSTLVVSGVLMRDPNNVPILPIVVDPPGGTELVVDDSPPSITNVLIDNTTIDNDAFVKNADNLTITA
ncbi:MAG: NosD domain-containing protein, partial [Bacteroidota bacterium]